MNGCVRFSADSEESGRLFEFESSQGNKEIGVCLAEIGGQCVTLLSEAFLYCTCESRHQPIYRDLGDRYTRSTASEVDFVSFIDNPEPNRGLTLGWCNTRDRLLHIDVHLVGCKRTTHRLERDKNYKN